MINGISGSSSNWQNLIINNMTKTETVGSPKAVKTSLKVEDRLEVLTGSQQTGRIQGGVTNPEQALKGTVCAKTAEASAFEVEVVGDEAISDVYSEDDIRKIAADNGLNVSQQKAAVKSFNALLAVNTDAAQTFLNILEMDEFKALPSNFKDDYLSFTAQYPSMRTVYFIQSLPELEWFNNLSSDDKTKATRVVAALLTEVEKGELTGDNLYIYGAAIALINGDIALEFRKRRDDEPYISSDNKTIYVDSEAVPAGRATLKGDVDANFKLESLSNVPFLWAAAATEADAATGEKGIWNALEALKKLVGQESLAVLSSECRIPLFEKILTCHSEGIDPQDIAIIAANTRFAGMNNEVQLCFIEKLIRTDNIAVMDILSQLTNSEVFQNMGANDQMATLNLFHGLTSRASEQGDELAIKAYVQAMDAILGGQVNVSYDDNMTDLARVDGHNVTIRNGDDEMMKSIADTLAAVILDAAAGVEVQTVITSADPTDQISGVQEDEGVAAAEPEMTSVIDRDPDLLNLLCEKIENSSDKKETEDLLVGILQNPAYLILDENTQRSLILLAADCNNLSELQDFSKMMNVLAGIDDTELCLCCDTLLNSAAPKSLYRLMTDLTTSERFSQMTLDERIAVLSQCKNFANANSINRLTSMVACDWFQSFSLEDKQRAAKSVAYLGETVHESQSEKQITIINNTLERLLSGAITLEFTNIEDDPGLITFGYACPGIDTIYINRNLVPDGNDTFPKDDDYACEAVLGTFSHEMNHKVNNDVNEATYRYFQGEYRAWYVGWIARYGVEPTRQEAIDRIIDILTVYDNINEAYFDMGVESAAMVAFITQIMGQKVNPQTEDELSDLFSLECIDGQLAAPEPDPALNPDLDN